MLNDSPTRRARTLAAALRRPLARWEQAIRRMSQEERRQLDDDAAALATHAARLSRYISRIEAGGKHADAVKAQNQAARRVRQALGFTYKDDAITF